jgi:hypothetical protein
LRLILPTGATARNGFTPSSRGALSQVGQQLRRNGDTLARKTRPHLEATLAGKPNCRIFQDRGAQDFNAVPE